MRLSRRSRVCAWVGVLTTLCGPSGCGGSAPVSTAPSSTATSRALTLDVSGAFARLVRWANAPTTITYEWCYRLSVTPEMADKRITVQRVDYTILGPNGSIYKSAVDTLFTGQKYGGGAAYGAYGCPIRFEDPDLGRALATDYWMRFEYTFDSGTPAGTQTVVAAGKFVSTVPTTPQMASVTIADDIGNATHTLRQPRPVTFTVTGAGGTPPYQYRWRLNGFQMRDWSVDPTLVWDGATLNGRPLISGAYTLAVEGRSAGATEMETGATLEIYIAF